MIVEITGPSGVGKTFYIGKILENLKKKGVETGAIHKKCSNQSLGIPNCLAELESQNIRTDFFVLPWTMNIVLKNPRFFFYIVSRIVSKDICISAKIKLLRGFLRKAGIFSYLSRKKFQNELIFVDEGLFHTVHNIFMGPDYRASKKDIDTFVELCPRPDFLLILLDEKDKILSNLHKRGSFSPRVNNQKQLIEFVKNSRAMYGEIITSLGTRPRVGIIHAPSSYQSAALQNGLDLIIKAFYNSL